jgi:hypothetical protein
MKPSKYYLLKLILPVLILSSCQLEEKLVDTPTPSLIKDQSDVTAVINGAYSQFNDAAAFKYQGMLMLFLCADDLYSDAGNELGAYSRRTYNSVNTAPSTG